MHIYINGYGTPKDPLNNENLQRYLNTVLVSLNLMRMEEIHFYLAGGYTNREDLSEAAAMKKWFNSQKMKKNVILHLLEETTTARDNLLTFRETVGDIPVFIYCELSREPTMKFFAKKLFTTATVLGINFDEKSMQLKHRILQKTVKLCLEKLAWHCKSFDAIRKKIRTRHIARAREKAKKE